MFMLLVGCTPKGRHTEQHDIFFGIAPQMADLKNDILHFWPEANGKIHIDAWREVNVVNNWIVKPVLRSAPVPDVGLPGSSQQLFFLNLGGYKPDEFEEYHYKLLTVSDDQATAIKEAKQTAFFKHFDYPEARSHIDDKYGVDVDDVYNVQDILPESVKAKYRIDIIPKGSEEEDKICNGYLKLSKLNPI